MLMVLFLVAASFGGHLLRVAAAVDPVDSVETVPEPRGLASKESEEPQTESGQGKGEPEEEVETVPERPDHQDGREEEDEETPKSGEHGREVK
jgi:hypothetical protein